MKRLRKRLKYTKIKYYACGEYGSDTARPHYHAIIYNLPTNITKDPNIIDKIWSKGHIHIDPVNTNTIRYVTKYILKKNFTIREDTDKRQQEFSLMSKGLGKSYLTPQMKNYHRENMLAHVTLAGGILTPLPRYFKDKIFDDAMKEQLSEEAELYRNYNFEKLFNSNHDKKLEWKNNLRKQEAKRLKQDQNGLISDAILTQITKVLKPVK
jgi:hypothetical protein